MPHKQSRLSRYKQDVNRHLKRLGWTKEDSYAWLNSHKDILREGIMRAVPAFELAAVVNTYMKGNA